MTDPTPTPSDAAPSGPGLTPSLGRCVTEIEAHVAAGGWDGPVRVFALVDSAAALAADPTLATRWPIDDDPQHLLAVEQEGLPPADSLEELLAQLAWPDTVVGAAVVVERIVVPPEAEQALDGAGDEAQAVAVLAAHPGAQDVRLAVGVLRTGESWCAVRVRSHDSGADVGGSPDAVPGLVEALAATLL